MEILSIKISIDVFNEISKRLLRREWKTRCTNNAVCQYYTFELLIINNNSSPSRPLPLEIYLYCRRLQNTRTNVGLTPSEGMKKELGVNVIENNALDSSVWLGGSILGSTDEFFDVCLTKAQYEEEGSRIFRQNVAFKAVL